MRKIVDLIESIDTNEVALYLDKCGILHASESKDNAMKYTVGKIMITDEVASDNGKPVFNGVAVDIYGAGDGYVYLSKSKREKDIRYIVLEDTYKVEGSVTVDRTKLPKAAHKAYRMANEFYMELAKSWLVTRCLGRFILRPIIF